MRIPFTGLSLVRTKALAPVDHRTGGGWYPFVREPWAGAWQQNVAIELPSVLTYTTVFACVSLIASDIAKMRLRLVEQTEDGIWEETSSAAFSPVLRKPNRYQTRIKFVEQWLLSKLTWGNTYVLKQRDNRGLVVALYILDPQRVRPLVASDGAVYYEVKRDDLSQVTAEQLLIPASEIIHDIMVALWHPLVGVSPIAACGLPATMGLKILNTSALLFANGSNPGGVLTAPGAISDATALRLKEYWDSQYTGANVGKVAVLGDGLKYEAMTMSAVDAQLIEHLKWSAEQVCSAFHVPSYMVGVGPPPNYNNIEALNQQYYSQCLQTLIESFELALDEGLALPATYGTEFDLDDLLRMDSKTTMETISRGMTSGVLKPNEGRAKLNLPPVPGGDTPYLQQQNYSLAALSRRDEQLEQTPPVPQPQPTPPPPEPDEDDDEEDDEREAAAVGAVLLKVLARTYATRS